MRDAQANASEICTLGEIKSHFESKKFEHVLNLTKKIYSTEEWDEYTLRARYYCLIEKGEFKKLLYEIMHMLVEGDGAKKSAKCGKGSSLDGNKGKKTFKDLFQVSYECIKKKNVLFELFYCMYKLKMLKKLNGCMKYVIEKENSLAQFMDVLLAEVNFRLHHFEASIAWYENLLESQNGKQVVAASTNVNSGYFSLYFKLLYEYNFLRSVNSRVSSDKAKQKDIEEVKNQILTNTDGFKYDEERDNFEQIFNYATFFIIEKNYPEAIKFLDLADAICRSTFVGGSASDCGVADAAEEVEQEEGDDVDDGKDNRESHVEQGKKRLSNHSVKNSLSLEGILMNKQMLVQLQRAYVYSKSNRLKDAIAIYENVLESYAENSQKGDTESTESLIPLVAYNNYLALRHNYEGESVRHLKPKGKSTPGSGIPSSGQVASASPPMFTLTQEKLNKIKSDLRMNKYSSQKDESQFMKSIALFNECISSLKNDQKDEFKSKLKSFTIRFGNSILLDKLIALFLKSENAYIKCKHHLLKNIHLMYSHQNKIKFLNAYLSLCYEKKSFTEIVKMYWKYEYVFKMDIHHYSTFFSNLFYVYICAPYGGESRPLMGKNNSSITTDGTITPHNLSLVIDLFNKYKQAIKADIRIVNYETVFLVSKYLLHHGKEELLTDLFDHLSKHVKNDFHFFSCFTYIYTFINMELTRKYEDKLKKAVLTETYLIDVEDLENKNITLGFSSSMGSTIMPGDANLPKGSLSTVPIDRNKKKRKRSKKVKNKKEGMGDHAGYDPEKWLPKHEKTGFKKSKKKKQKTAEASPKPKVVIVEEPKNNPSASSKLQGLKKRRKK
ncbi:signal recognition particle subunit SRP72, putative [Plasmodium knowlesi strain H]|uniref:Signal recognition particle subunit SRP72, putative n=3 Tax=Plasmodium knowlesi TaxID=5850 RepID=A0A5K1U2E5_PLAKH|nr:signal recognition particle subunit SRP72, putative [Plasmodium knowlesi strain H]OTN64837.1 putative Signal recognition particle subunit SRP72 [Plasmodium knowlesi]CAA9988390.1 signal recognition particle subunit SRP72, putative [Plasmodium knowlesi strain H]SBO19971.1 signal recognition particle subunit SRP72, putative [Plasmodium knowlesi strain H]SBO20360.1 signal recognition particle subunit SRP72, putative [Plasmodium knowlesi strain H]VVS77864.1 signal recognition particle subunit SR|eukprot:XP_002259371.1 hypothetical protein, conserved in Plasmodium species [Plasmodium knowlesi strain H]